MNIFINTHGPAFQPVHGLINYPRYSE